MTIDTAAIIGGIAILLIGGGIIATIRHTTNDNIHPKKDDIVFNKTCEAEMDGMRDCVEAKLDAVKEKIENIDETSKQILNILLRRK
jgi:hypothetical protein